MDGEKVAPLPIPDSMAESRTGADVRNFTSLSNPRAADIDDDNRGNRSNHEDDEDEGLPLARRRRSISHESYDQITYGSDLDPLGKEGDEKEKLQDEDEDDDDYVDVDDVDDEDEGSQCAKRQKLESPTHRDMVLKDSPTPHFQLSHRSPSTSSADEFDYVESRNHNERLSPSSCRRSPTREILSNYSFDTDAPPMMTLNVNTSCRGFPSSLQIRTSGSTTFYTFIVQQGHLPPTPSSAVL